MAVFLSFLLGALLYYCILFIDLSIELYFFLGPHFDHVTFLPADDNAFCLCFFLGERGGGGLLLGFTANLGFSDPRDPPWRKRGGVEEGQEYWFFLCLKK